MATFDPSMEYWRTLTRRVCTVLLAGSSSTNAKTPGEIGKALVARYGTDGHYSREDIREALQNGPQGVTVFSSHARYWASGQLLPPEELSFYPEEGTTLVRPRQRGHQPALV